MCSVSTIKSLESRLNHIKLNSFQWVINRTIDKMNSHNTFSKKKRKILPDKADFRKSISRLPS